MNEESWNEGTCLIWLMYHTINTKNIKQPLSLCLREKEKTKSRFLLSLDEFPHD